MGIVNFSNQRFNGCSPGYLSASIGHHFANPTNHFWKCLYQSGKWLGIAADDGYVVTEIIHVIRPD